MKRKIIQISACESIEHDVSMGTSYSLYAVCNDGTVWDYRFRKGEWEQLADIPQDKEDE